MQYKTIVLELLEQDPELRSQPGLPAELDRYATELRRLHAAWVDLLRLIRPESDPGRVSSQALDLAVEKALDLAVENLRGIWRQEFLTGEG